MKPASYKRRQTLQILSSAGVLGIVGNPADAASCKVSVESTAGPYPNINPLERRDLRSNTSGNTSLKPGAPLTLRIKISDLENACGPIAGAVVDIWGADAVGKYSSYSPFGTQGQDFCRGYQRTDANGVAEFLTLFPGSYTGRAIHIHISIQSAATNIRPNDHGNNLAKVFIAQLYFARSQVNEVFSSNPIYQQGAPITPNESDSIYTGEGGSSYIVNVTKAGNGYVGDVEIGVRRAAIGMDRVTPPKDIPLVSGTAVAIKLAANASQLYSIAVPAGKTKLVFKLSGGTGDGDLYARATTPPTTTSYTVKSDGQTNAETITINSPVAAKHYVLVNAYAAVTGASLVATLT